MPDAPAAPFRTPAPASGVPAAAVLTGALQAPPDGLAFIEAQLADLARRVAAGERVAVVFDIDNTLADTRHRTVAAARAFGRAHGIPELAAADLDHAGWDGRETCARLGLATDVGEAFQTFWTDFFWRPESFALDQPIALMVGLARRAAAAGAEVVYLTGRVDYDATLSQLGRFGLPNVDAEHVRCKPAVGVRTTTYKEAELRALRAVAHVAWFLTEGTRDIAHLQSAFPDVASVHFAFPVDGEVAAIRPDTPVIPER